MNEKRFPPINLPNISQTFSVDTTRLDATLKRLAEDSGRTAKEKIEREEKTIELLEQIVQLGLEKPEFISQINTLIANSTIHNMQNNYDNSFGVQHTVNNFGMTAQEFSEVMNHFKELAEIMIPVVAKETTEIVEQLANEIQKEEPKKGLVKALLAYLYNFATDIITDPIKVVAKKEFSAFAIDKAHHILEGVQKLINFFNG